MVWNNQMTIDSIELTNLCNLRCGSCPVSGEPKQYGDGVDYPKGMLSLKNLLKALKYCKPTAEFSVNGEPLLHPDVCEFIEIAKHYGKSVGIHTNGTLLTEELCNKLIDSGVNRVQISVHTELSLKNFKMLFDINEKRSWPIKVTGEFLTCEAHMIKEWVNINGLEDKHCADLSIGPTHNWARNEISENDYMQKCTFISKNCSIMKWDGTIVSCCFDFEGVNKIGHIDNFPKLRHKPDYELCKRCSPAWVNQNNVWWWKLTKGANY